jgi:predicted nucleic acid-binding protein
MAVVLDTGVVVAIMDRRDANHEAVVAWLQTFDDDLVTTPLTLAEMDHFAFRVGGQYAVEQLWGDLDRGAYGVRWWRDGLRDTLDIVRHHPQVGLVDASLVALASVLDTTRIATTDQRHFRSLGTVSGDPFILLPADA